MLLELRIRDFAIIDELELHFDSGFSVLTGETGAGKSIIVDAVELVLGEWADSAVVRSGAERAIVETVFRLDPKQRSVIGTVLQREGLEGDNPDLLLLGREVRLNKRNICRVNGRAVTLRLLREITEGLVDIHGQSEHLSLLRPREQIRLLDRYADVEPLRGEVGDAVHRVREVRQELTDLRRDEQELMHRADLLQFQIDEIEAAALQPGEEETLRQQRPRLANAERLTELTREVAFALEEGDRQAPSALDLIGAALQALTEAARVDPSLEPLLEEVESVSLRLEEIARQLRDYRERIEYNPQRLQEVEDRLALIQRLERKYGETIADVLDYAEEAVRELDTITHSEERVAELEAKEGELLEEVSSLAIELSRRRREAAQRLSQEVEEELDDLGMEHARFGMDFRWQKDDEGVPLPQSVPGLRFRVSSSGVEQPEASDLKLDETQVAFEVTGIDQVEFLVSPNPGEPLKSMAKIASGGETSRLMLALKAVLSRADETPTLVFDEIDQGIGGRVGATVGQKLWGLTAGTDQPQLAHQVLCVTHLPQLAGFGDAHFRVEKHVKQTQTGERTVTKVRPLERRARVEELTQMLGGGDAAHRSAEEILKQVARCKRREVEGGEREA